MNIIRRWLLRNKLIRMLKRDYTVSGRIAAIKTLRNARGIGLKEAKDYIDQLIAEIKS